MNRTERLYKIQRLLESQRIVHINEFLRVLEVSRATFRRDLEYLRDRLSAPILWDRENNGYTLDRKSKVSNPLPGLWFTESEVHALLTILQLLAELKLNELVGHQIQSLQERLNGILEKGCADREELTGRVKILTVARRNIDNHHFQTIASALMRRQRLEIHHLSRQKGMQSERQISPQQLIYYRDNWYLDAFCHARDDLRTFSIDSITRISPSEKPAVALPRETLQRRFSESYGIFNAGQVQTAKLRFSPFRARWVSNESWHPKQRSEFEPDGHYILEIPYSDERELIPDILRQGEECEVIGPLELRQAVTSRLLKNLNLYQKNH